LRRATLSAAPPPGFLELTTTAAADFLRQRFRAVRSLPNLAWTLAKASRTLGRDVQYSLAYVWKTPRTRFNVAVSSQRSYGTASLSLPDVKALAKARNVTINDVVLAVCAGALRRYLIERQSLPDLPLTAAVPASLRAPGDNRMNNQLMFLLCRLATNVSDPLVRLAATQVAAREAKNLLADVKDLVTADVPVLGAPTIMTALYQLLQRTNSAWWNVVISNVPGPRQPIHCADAAGRHYFPLSALMHGCALNITVFGYIDLLEFGLTACRTAAPDVQLIGDYLVEDFEAMQRASAALGRPDAVATIEIARPRSLLTREAKLEGPAAKPRLTRVSAKGAEASVRAKRASVKQPPATAETNAEAEPAEKKTKRRQAANPRARPRAPERVAGT
jgi:WS/DGAT/MGAT family acyltransferase